MTSVVIQTAFLGDVVLTTPLIAELARRGPVDVVVRPDGAALLANNPGIRDVIVFDKRRVERGLRGLWRMARRLRRREDDAPRGATTAYLAQASVRSGALALLARIDERVGFAGASGRRFYTRRVPFRDDRHHAERLWRLAMPADIAPPPAETIRPRLYPGDAERAIVDALLAEAGLAGEPFIVVAPGSAWGTKRWPGYAALAAMEAPRRAVVVIGSAADAALAEPIVDAARGAGGLALDASGKLSLLSSAELVRRAEALVTNDSSPLHLASAMDTPTVAIFGPTVAEFGFGPLATRSAVVGLDELPCRPCDRHGPQVCPLGHWKCMLELSPALVADRLRAISPP